VLRRNGAHATLTDMYMYNPPSNLALRDSIEKILQKSFFDSSSGSFNPKKIERPLLYLVNNLEDIQSLPATLTRIIQPDTEMAVSALSLPIAIELRKQEAWLQQHAVHVIGDYSSPHNAHEDKRVFFYSSGVIRPFISHVYKEISTFLSPLAAKYRGSIAPIGSDLLPDFPCKLDVDILACVPDKKDYESFCQELARSGVFVVPPREIGELHRFFYAQLFGAPIDLHVYNAPLERCPLYNQTQQLQNDAQLRDKYKQFKLKNEGVKIDEYRRAKAAFRKEIGWTS